MRVTPKISDKPAATRNSVDASASPLTSCTSKFESIATLGSLRNGEGAALAPSTRSADIAARAAPCAHASTAGQYNTPRRKSLRSFGAPAKSPHANSAQTVFALDLAHLQAADARQRPPRRRHRDGHDDFVRTRRVRHARFDRIEMAAHEGGVFMAERHVDRGAERAHLLRRRDQR